MKKTLVLCFLFVICFIGHGQNSVDQKLKRPLEDLEAVEPEVVNLNPDSIEGMLNVLRQEEAYDFRGVVVIKDSKLVLEEYFYSYWRETIHDIRSAGKSITALLVGIAIDKGLIESVDQKVYDFFPEFASNPNITEEHRNITIKHLLMMSSGMDSDTDDINSPGNWVNWGPQDNWVEIALNVPMKFDSGEKWVYNDICAMLCSAIIQKASGKPLDEFAKEHLFEPLGIREYYWYRNAQNITGGMGNLYITNLDFAKIGLLVLNKGKWKNQQIISANWIEEISTKRLDLPDLGPFANSYGYFWWIGQKNIHGKDYEYFFASGNGGNKLYIIPQENIVISIQSSAYGQGYGHRRANFILDSILKSIQFH